MGYYDEAKHACPLCRAPMVQGEEPDPGDPYPAASGQRYEWDVYQCTSPECGIRWRYGDIYNSETDQAHVIHIHDAAPRPGRSERSIEMSITWWKDEYAPDGRVDAMVFVNPKPFRRRPKPLDIDVQAAALISGDRDRALREAFSVWRLRAFA